MTIRPPYSATAPADSLHPAFCFKHLDKKLGFPQDKKHRAAILNTVNILSKFSWAQIGLERHDGNGYEKITKLKKVPPIALRKETPILSFRCSDDGRMIGYRDQKILYVFWFDWSPFEVYSH